MNVSSCVSVSLRQRVLVDIQYPLLGPRPDAFLKQELFGDSSEDEVETEEVVFVKQTSKADIKHEVIDLLSSEESGDEQKTPKIDLKIKKEIKVESTCSAAKKLLKKSPKEIDVKHKNDKNHHKQSGVKTTSSKNDTDKRHHSKDVKSSKSSSDKKISSSKSKDVLNKTDTNSVSKKSSSRDKKEDESERKRSNSVSKDGEHKQKMSKDRTKDSSKVCDKSSKQKSSSKDKTKEISKVCDESSKQKSSLTDKTREISKMSDKSSKQKSSSRDKTKEGSKVCYKSSKQRSSSSKDKSKETSKVCDKSSKQKSSSSKDKINLCKANSAIETSNKKKKDSDVCVNLDDDDSDAENHALSDGEIPEDFHMDDTDISFSETDTYDECLKIFNESTVPLNDSKKKEVSQCFFSSFKRLDQVRLKQMCAN